MMSAAIDTRTGGNDSGQDDNPSMSLLEALPKEGETIMSAPTDTETETNNCSQENSGKMSNDESLPKELETVKPGSTDTQTETTDCGPDPEKGHVHVPYIKKESLASLPEHSASRNASSDDLEGDHNNHSREVFGPHSPTETQDLKPGDRNFLLHQGMQVSEITAVMKSHIDEGLVCATQVSEPVTAVNKALKDKPLAGKSEEILLKEMGEKNLDKNKPSTSVSYVQQKPPDAYVKKSFACDNSMVDEDEELREHWTRTLQTRTSTGEVVEEIVRVLKHQKTHDLLCPVCGSCITKRVVLRKRKRLSLIYDSEEYAEVPGQGGSSEIMDVHAGQGSLQDSRDPATSDKPTRDTVAYGCLACFSLFFKKGHRLWSHTEGAAERDTISCLPFFFPPYPWGMNRRRKSNDQEVMSPVPQQPSVDPDQNSTGSTGSLQPVSPKPNLGEIPPEEDPGTPPQSPDQTNSVSGNEMPGVGKSKSKAKLRWQIASIFPLGRKDTKDDLKEPLLDKSPELQGSQSSDSLLNIKKPSDGGSQLVPSIPAMPAPAPNIEDNEHLDHKKPSKNETAIDVHDSDDTHSVADVDSPGATPGPVATTRPAEGPGATPGPVATTRPAEGREILRSIVYGGLEISIASLGVTSSAAGGDAITRTVVYMGLATLLSGLSVFYHNVLNLYYYHQEHYTMTVGKTLLLHGTLALVSYILFGALSSVTYGFSFRESNSRDRKFALCCVVTFVSVFFLSLGKAHVTNKLYLKTVSAYIAGGFLAAIIGYLAGDHISELLESWGL